MASKPIDFCEPANPRVLDEVRRVNRFENARRIHNGLRSSWEQRALTWMAERTPGWINSDHLTILGLLAQVMAGVSYALARWNRYWLLAVLLLSIQSYLATYTLGEFQLSCWNFGPTELRILLAVGNLALLYRPIIFHGRYRLFDVGGVIGLVGMAVMLICFTARNTRRLYLEERIR